MFKTFRLGRLFGFPIEVNMTFLLMLGAVLLWMGGLAGVFVVLVAFASVLLHELGHSVVARRLGVRIAGIELHFFGGAAKMIDQPRSARDEILIAIAGPAVSVVLAAIGWAAHAMLGTATGASLFYLIAYVNTVIALFNLIPALPMDGGRVLRATLSLFTSFERATRMSVTLARLFTIALVTFALATAQVTLVLLGIVLWMMGSAELRFAHLGGYQGNTGIPSATPNGWEAMRGGAVVSPRGHQRSRGVVELRRFGNRTVLIHKG